METLTPTTANSKEGPTNDFHHHVVDDDSELELGLSLGCSGGGGGGIKFLTAQDLPSLGSHGLTFSSRTHQAAIIRPQLSSISGYKRAADHHHDASAMASSPPALSQVVGWPPVGSYRMNNLANQTRSSNPEDGKINGECGNKKMNNGGESKVKSPQENPYLGFVKVNMDGVQIGRKLDLNAHSSYESLAQAIQDMFFRPSSASLNSISGEKDQQGKASKLLDGSSEFVLTYEDKESDWMLVGDVPFRMFLGTVKRLRIMRTSEANGLAPRSQERSDNRLRSKPI